MTDHELSRLLLEASGRCEAPQLAAGLLEAARRLRGAESAEPVLRFAAGQADWYPCARPAVPVRLLCHDREHAYFQSSVGLQVYAYTIGLDTWKVAR